MTTTWKAAVLCVLFCAILFSPSQARGQIEKSAGKTKSPPVTKPDARNSGEIDMLLFEFGNAINAGNVNRTMSFWSDDALFVDQSGEETRSRSALESRFAKLFEERGRDSLTLHAERTTFPADNVALVVGEISRKKEGIELPASRFTMVLIKQNGTWLINEATETVIQEKKPSDQLKLVSWLVGDWKVADSTNSVRLDVKWSENRNLLLSKSITEKNDGSKSVDYQIIGFDPRTNNIVSWHFASNGGFGYGKWTKNGEEWSVDYAGVDQNGANTSARNIFTPKGSDGFTWHSVDQIADEKPIPDTAIVTLERIKK
ncbi:MAG: nuclear transport factor 2 family protein [Candidatus Obscuribacterales bacterium]|nr:nuclear transport factor 2 family protein [Candidatus Obscuribacterales bacterium]